MSSAGWKGGGQFASPLPTVDKVPQARSDDTDTHVCGIVHTRRLLQF